MISTNRTVEELIRIEIQEAYLAWGATQPLRIGAPHASDLLCSDADWCTRRYVLAQLEPDAAEREEAKYWQWKQKAIYLYGWEIHRALQLIFKNHLNVVYTDGKPELDLTHYDAERNVYFSPDAILDFWGIQYVVEIKGIKQESFLALTNSLESSMQINETVDKAFHQAQLYMHLLKLTRGIILIVNKNDNQQFKLWVIEYDQQIYFNGPRERIYDVKGTLALTKAGKPSVKMARICQSASEPRARKCPMRDVCFREKE